jgi:predicted CXXCH cytochrome family protein
MRGLILLGLALFVTLPLQAQRRTRSPHGDLKMECAACHGGDGWTPVRIAKTFDHSKLGFALTGAHGTATCRACHQALDFKGVKSDCVSCHADPHRSELGANCARCHTARSFLDRDAMTKAHQLTRFPLQGGHLGVDCSDCHKPGGQGSLQFVGTRTECVSCHKSDFNTAPNHVASSFPTTCAECHSQVAWNRVGGLGGNHPSTPVALTGVHANKQCTDCHLAGQAYSAVKQTCDGCHHGDFVGAKDPDHLAAGFSTTCTTCHALVAGWTGAAYASHSTAPINPKQGAHGAVTCTQCHTRSPYASAPTTCDACHHADYVTAASPSHTASGFATTCADCHQIVAGWTGATYASHPSTPLAMTGLHAMPPRTCADCHATTTYASVATTCDGCHHTTYVGVTDPNHTAAGMAAFAAANCSNCHAPTKAAWTGPTWTHMTIVTPRSLRLPHQGASCANCHQTASNYTVKSCAGAGCHKNATGP